jgi:hypothetical protein
VPQVPQGVFAVIIIYSIWRRWGWLSNKGEKGKDLLVFLLIRTKKSQDLKGNCSLLNWIKVCEGAIFGQDIK